MLGRELVTTMNRRVEVRAEAPENRSAEADDACFHLTSDGRVFSCKVLVLSTICTLLTNTKLVPLAGKTAAEALVAICNGFQPYKLRHWFVLLAYYCLFSASIRSVKRGGFHTPRHRFRTRLLLWLER